jgi:hypothetical protein
MVVLFDVRLLVCVLALLAETEDGEEGVEEGASAAEEADKEEQQYAQDNADDDTSNGTATEAGVALFRWDEAAACCARGDGCLEGEGYGRAAGVGDNYNA